MEGVFDNDRCSVWRLGLQVIIDCFVARLGGADVLAPQPHDASGFRKRGDAV